MVDTAKLINLLKNGEVKINYIHWKTDEPLEVIASQGGCWSNQSDKSDTIVVYDTIDNKWEDVRVSTITSFEVN